jgi:hypothetical protein
MSPTCITFPFTHPSTPQKNKYNYTTPPPKNVRRVALQSGGTKRAVYGGNAPWATVGAGGGGAAPNKTTLVSGLEWGAALGQVNTGNQMAGIWSGK